MLTPTHSVFFIRTILPWFVAFLAGGAAAQTSADQRVNPLPTQLQYTSTLGGYQAYTDQAVLPWREANDRVGRIGGWRAYAKEASTGQSTSDVPAAPDSHDGHHEGTKR